MCDIVEVVLVIVIVIVVMVVISNFNIYVHLFKSFVLLLRHFVVHLLGQRSFP